MEQSQESTTASLAVAWENRYAAGRDSGAGSRGGYARAKADYVNALIEREQIQSVIDWGCGDGGQLGLLSVPARYIGVDISRTALGRCRALFPKRRFILYDPLQAGALPRFRADLALSMDVVFHLVDNHDFRTYLWLLFRSARQFVLIYSSNVDGRHRRHVRHRLWTPYARSHFPAWELIDQPAGSMGFFLYRLREVAQP